MQDHVFVPVQCPNCSRIGVNRFRHAELKRMFSSGTPISLRCPIDGQHWLASGWERTEIGQVLRETEAVANKTEIALRLDPHAGDEVLPSSS